MSRLSELKAWVNKKAGGLRTPSAKLGIAIFDDLKADFEYVFRNLHVQAQDRREFAQRVKERATRKS
jgi:hypothetical protein